MTHTFSLDEARDQAQHLIATRAFKRGDFKLASGRRSPFYFNLKSVMLSAQGSRALGQLLAHEANALKPDLLGGMEVGAIPLTASALAFWPDEKAPAGFFIRKQAKAHGSMARIEGVDEKQVKNHHAVMIEDVTTTGGSALEAAEIIRAAGGNVEIILSVVDRCEGAQENLAKAGLKIKSLFTPEDF